MADETPEITTQEEEETGGSMMYYIIGALVVVAIAAGVWFLRPKVTQPPIGIGSPVVPTPTPGPITSLNCGQQYYNPVIGFPQYFLSVEGVDVPAAKSVTCDFNVSIGGTIAASASAQGELSASPERSGQTFRCTTKKLELTPQIPTVVNITLKDDLGLTQTCTTTYVLPKP